MHALQINFFLDPARGPREILSDWQALPDIAYAAAAAGVRVSVVQACATEAVLHERGIDFHFVAPTASGESLTRAGGFRRLLGQLAPDVAHVHGLGFAHDVLELRALSPRLPILLQDHADRVPRFWRRGVLKRALGECAAVSFCAREQAEPFRRAGLMKAHVSVFEIPESTSAFEPGDRAAARAATGMHGNPALLWVGHLDANKDPLTVLDAASTLSRELPELELWCCFGSAPLREQVEARIASDPALRARVHLIGRVPHARVETLMRAADLFVLGSHREGSSFSLIEALATGLTPVVTAIPSLRMLTGNGSIGELFPCGDAVDCAEALLRAARSLHPGSRERVRAHFDAHLSHRAIGRRFADAYYRIRGAARAPTAA